MKLKFIIFSFLILSFLESKVALANENIFGIHILEPSEIGKAAQLVNSAGGDWGYVTIVIRDNDLSRDKWQGFMDLCRENHLIPLVRLATHLDKENWLAPNLEEALNWANFLNSLNWPVKDRYLIIFNEPNQAKEWGGGLDPQGYARILEKFSLIIKEKNPNFKILNAGFDLAAGNTKTTMEVLRFWQQMNQEIPGIFNYLDGWASHSYPNHGYLGKPWDQGKTSIQGYQWELAILRKSFGLEKDLPVFITETGWPKKILIEGQKYLNQQYYDQETVAEYLKSAFENVWLSDHRIKAVTPFLLNYPENLFYSFSWLDKNGNPFKQFETIKSLSKFSWWPDQETKFFIEPINLPPFLLTGSSFYGQVKIVNEGQSILGEKDQFTIRASGFDHRITVSSLELKDLLKPGQTAYLNFEIKTSSQAGNFSLAWEGLGNYKVNVLKPSILARVKFSFWKNIWSKIQLWWRS